MSVITIKNDERTGRIASGVRRAVMIRKGRARPSHLEMRRLRQADLGDRRHGDTWLEARVAGLVPGGLSYAHSNGICALQLQKKQLGLGSYKTAWLLCAKLRERASVLAGHPAERELGDILEHRLMSDDDQRVEMTSAGTSVALDDEREAADRRGAFDQPLLLRSALALRQDSLIGNRVRCSPSFMEYFWLRDTLRVLR